MVKIMVRAIQQIKNWEKLEEYNKKMTDIETKIGMPAKRRYRTMAAGSNNINSLVLEWDYKSMAQYEELFHKCMGSPEHMKGTAEGADIVGEIKFELYMVWPPAF